MADPIALICSLTGCTEDEANEAYNRTEDVVEAVDSLLSKVESPADKYIQTKKRKREVTPEEEIIGPYRKILKEFDERMSTSLNQHGHEGSVEMLDHHEETVQQNSCSQKCQLPSLQEEVQTQETAYPLPSECSCDLQSNGQTLPCSDRQCPQSCQDQEME
jgi:hypothetical protein